MFNNEHGFFRLIGQNVLVETAISVEISTDIAVISFFEEDTGWTKRVGIYLGKACNFNIY